MGKFKLLIVISFVLLLVACGSDDTKANNNSSEKPKELVVVDWGGATSEAAQKAWYKPFEEKHNVKIKLVNPSSDAKLKAMVDAGNVTWDAVQTDPWLAISLGNDGYLEEMDYDTVDTEGIYPYLKYDYGIGFQITHHNISYNTDVYKNGDHPKSWKDFYDMDKFEGKRGLYDNVVGTMENVLMSDGVEPDELYPLDVDRAFEALDRYKDNILWWESLSQPPQLLDTKEINISHALNAHISNAKNKGMSVENEYNQAIEWYNAWVVPKDAPNKELAMEFINYAVSPEAQAEYFKLVDYAPANEKAIELLPDEKRDLYTELANKEDIVKSDQQWWSENFSEVRKRFDEWILK